MVHIHFFFFFLHRQGVHDYRLVTFTRTDDYKYGPVFESPRNHGRRT